MSRSRSRSLVARVHAPALALTLALGLGLLPGAGCGGGGDGAREEPGIPVGSPEWWTALEPQAYEESWERVNEQLHTPGYLESVSREWTRLAAFWVEEDASEFVDRPRITLTRGFPLLNVGDPWRSEVVWRGGVHERVYLLNRWGAKLTADLWGPPDLFERGERRPAVVVTDGSVQANARMYWWAAEALAESGYVVLTYDVQGQGESETYGHREDGSVWCGGVEQPPDTPPFLRELTGCPGVPFQQPANFAGGAVDMHNWLLSTPAEPYEHFREGTGTKPFNPWHALVDPERVGAAGHSLGAAAVSFVQGRPDLLRRPIRAVVGWDELVPCASLAYIAGKCEPGQEIEPLAPALNLASDYFLPAHIRAMPVPTVKREAFEAWRAAGVDVLSIILAAATHLEYTTGPFHMATRYGQDISTYYTLAFFDRYLGGDAAGARKRLLAREVAFTHRNPVGVPDAEPTSVAVRDFASFLSYSAVSLGGACYRDWKYKDDPC